jgi:hypothetical protein
VTSWMMKRDYAEMKRGMRIQGAMIVVGQQGWIHRLCCSDEKIMSKESEDVEQRNVVVDVWQITRTTLERPWAVSN